MSAWKSIVLFLVFLPLTIHGEEKVEWPELSDVKFVSGRPATEDDINAGAAVFLLQSEGVSIGTPIEIEIPQYAIHTDGDSGENSNVIVIQAEESNDQKVIGALIVGSSEFMVGFFNEFKFIGNNKPND